MRIWVCVTNSNGISVFPKLWVVASTDAGRDNSPWHQWRTPAKLTLRRGKEDRSSSLKRLFVFLSDISWGEGLIIFNSLFPRSTPAIGCRADTASTPLLRSRNGKVKTVNAYWQSGSADRKSATQSHPEQTNFAARNWLITHLSVPAQEQCCFCRFTWLKCFCLTGFAHTFLIYHSLWFNSSFTMEFIWPGLCCKLAEFRNLMKNSFWLTSRGGGRQLLKLHLSFGTQLKKKKKPGSTKRTEEPSPWLDTTNGAAAADYTSRVLRGCKLFEAASFQSIIITFGTIMLLLMLYQDYVITCRHHFSSVDANTHESRYISDIFSRDKTCHCCQQHNIYLLFDASASLY